MAAPLWDLAGSLRSVRVFSRSGAEGEVTEPVKRTGCPPAPSVNTHWCLGSTCIGPQALYAAEHGDSPRTALRKGYSIPFWSGGHRISRQDSVEGTLFSECPLVMWHSIAPRPRPGCGYSRPGQGVREQADPFRGAHSGVGLLMSFLLPFGNLVRSRSACERDGLRLKPLVHRQIPPQLRGIMAPETATESDPA